MDGWDRLTRSVDGQELPARSVIFSRWREVEVHQVDLGLGYEPGEWPDDLVELWLPQAKEQFLTPADDRDLLASEEEAIARRARLGDRQPAQQYRLSRADHGRGEQADEEPAHDAHSRHRQVSPFANPRRSVGR